MFIKNKVDHEIRPEVMLILWLTSLGTLWNQNRLLKFTPFPPYTSVLAKVPAITIMFQNQLPCLPIKPSLWSHLTLDREAKLVAKANRYTGLADNFTETLAPEWEAGQVTCPAKALAAAYSEFPATAVTPMTQLHCISINICIDC